jgi:hypothetical protein
VSKFNWKREAARIRKMCDEVDAIRERLWKSEDDPLGWDLALIRLAETLDLTAKQIEQRTDQRPKRIA